MANNVFDKSHLWTKNDVATTGLPRPFAYTYRKDMPKIVPIPWQSMDNFKINKNLGLNLRNEKMVYENNLCSYCGIKINNDEICKRWNTAPLEKLFAIETVGNVLSDIHPLHTECMKQARTFCPFMKTLKDKDFETGLYKELKQNAINDVIKSKELRNEKIIQKDIQS